MAIYGIGATFDYEDVSQAFLANNIAGIGWYIEDAPELHQFIKTLKVGDIIYIKSFAPSLEYMTIKGIGFIRDFIMHDLDSNALHISIGRNVMWIDTNEYQIPKPSEKNNVRNNSIFEEYHPQVQQFILDTILNNLDQVRHNIS